MGFASQAQAYVASPAHAAGADLETVLSWAAVRPESRALDVATGGGHVALGLARRGARVTMLDAVPEMLDAAGGLLWSEGYRAERVVGDACDMPFADGEFEVVTCRIAAHHFRSPEAFFREAARVLAPGGRLVFQDQALPEFDAAGVFVDAFERLRDPSHVHARSVTGWLRAATTAGLVPEAHTLTDKRHDFAEWCARQACDGPTIESLLALARRLPSAASEWLDPEWYGGDDPDVPVAQQARGVVSFRNRHLLLLAHKPSV